MAGERLSARFSLGSQVWFRWTGKCFETATSHMQTVNLCFILIVQLIVLWCYNVLKTKMRYLLYYISSTISQVQTMLARGKYCFFCNLSQANFHIQQVKSVKSYIIEYSLLKDIVSVFFVYFVRYRGRWGITLCVSRTARIESLLFIIICAMTIN